MRAPFAQAMRAARRAWPPASRRRSWKSRQAVAWRDVEVLTLGIAMLLALGIVQLAQRQA